MVKVALGFGGSHGKGVATCRTAGGWSAPAPITVTGGSWGLQLGGQAVDLVMLVMNDKGMEHLLSSKFKIGADASEAAGPVGHHASADTDWKMKSEVLTYSRARGVFGNRPEWQRDYSGQSRDAYSVRQDGTLFRYLERKGFASGFQPHLSSSSGEICASHAAAGQGGEGRA